MKRIIIGGLVGGVVAYVWSSLVWMVLPIYNDAMNTLPDDVAVMTLLGESGAESGIYFFPNMPTDMKDEAGMAAYTELHNKGPIGFLAYTAEGQDLMPPSMFAKGIALNLLAGLMLAWIVAQTTCGFGGRLAIVVVAGLFAFLTGAAMQWNWFYFPTDFTLASLVDRVLGSILEGLAIAGIVKPTRG